MRSSILIARNYLGVQIGRFRISNACPFSSENTIFSRQTGNVTPVIDKVVNRPLPAGIELAESENPIIIFPKTCGGKIEALPPSAEIIDPEEIINSKP